MEFDPGCREGGAPLDAAFEGGGEGDKGCGGGANRGGFFGVGEVCAGGAVAVPVVCEFVSGYLHWGCVCGFLRFLGRMGRLPEIIVEVVGAGLVGFVAEDDARSAMVGLTGGVSDKAFWRWAVRHGGIVAWGRVAV